MNQYGFNPALCSTTSWNMRHPRLSPSPKYLSTGLIIFSWCFEMKCSYTESSKTLPFRDWLTPLVACCRIKLVLLMDCWTGLLVSLGRWLLTKIHGLLLWCLIVLHSSSKVFLMGVVPSILWPLLNKLWPCGNPLCRCCQAWLLDSNDSLAK